MCYRQRFQLPIKDSSISSYGTSYLTLSCSLKLKIDMYGDSLQMVNIPLNRLMRTYFWDLLFSGHGKRLGRLGHRPNVVSFCGWLLIIDVGQRIAYLAEVSLTLSAVLCVTKQQKPLIISLFSVSSQENSGSVSCHKLACNPSPLSPLISHFFDWWDRVSSATSDIILQGINSLIILGAWTVWTHRNSCVFDGAAPDIARALIIAGEERKLWSMAGARGISLLTAPHSES